MCDREETEWLDDEKSSSSTTFNPLTLTIMQESTVGNRSSSHDRVKGRTSVQVSLNSTNFVPLPLKIMQGIVVNNKVGGFVVVLLLLLFIILVFFFQF